MSKAKKRLVFAGTGGMGQAAHLSSYVLLKDECEVVACADMDGRKAELVTTQHGIPRSYHSFEDMLSQESYDGIIASQQFQHHHALVPQLLAYGKPVFIEKPLASSLAAAQKLSAGIQGKQDLVFVGYHKRSDLATEYAKQLIDEFRADDEKGKFTHLRVVMPPGDWMQGGWPHRRNVPNQEEVAAVTIDDADPDSSEEQKQHFTFFVNYYIHQVNLLRFLLGEDYRVQYASPNQCLLVGESMSGTSICLEMGTYQSCTGWHEKAEAYFERASIRLNLPSPLAQCKSGTVDVFENNYGLSQEQETRVTFANEHAMLSQAKNFLKFLDGEYPNRTSLDDAMKDLEVAQAYLDLLNLKPQEQCQ